MIIGVTGGLATGTSSASEYIRSYLKGYIIDADKVSHLVLRKNSPAYKKVVLSFGRTILKKGGVIDRSKLARKVFSNKKSLKELSAIVHPVVISRIADTIGNIYRKKPSAFIIVDGSVLIESGFYRRCDRVTVIVSSLMSQFERIRNYKSLSIKDALLRIGFQLPLHKKVRYADYIIDNSGSLADLRRKCKRAAEEMKNLTRRR